MTSPDSTPEPESETPSRDAFGTILQGLLWPVAAGLGGYAALVGAMYTMQRSFMYYPHPVMTSPMASGMPEMEEVRLSTSDGLTVTSWYTPPRPGQPTVLYCHGNAGNVATRAFKVKPFLNHGYGALLVGYRGYGTNQGTPSETGLNADATAALHYLLAQGIARTQVVIYGESLGTGVAVTLASEHHPGAVVLEAPFTSAVDVARRTYWYLPVQHLMRDRFDSLKRIKEIGAPVLVLHGEKDGVVPVDLGRQLFAAAQEPKEFAAFPEGMHGNLHEHGSAEQVMAFIERHLNVGGGGGGGSHEPPVTL
ncbi:MAG: hypothetical protein FD149_509 [Rhodospirillaceae bacterium]|nr:MAG: hypothetical protein FD149_509 [Rhodospirillaceae bacterium]